MPTQKILWLKIGQHFEPEVWLRFGSWSLVEIPKLNFDQLATWLKNSYFVESMQPLGLYCLWQFFLPIHSSLFWQNLTIFSIFTHSQFLWGRLTWHIGCCNIKHQAMHTFLSFCRFCNCLQLLFPVAVAPSQCHPSWNISTSISLSSFLLF